MGLEPSLWAPGGLTLQLAVQRDNKALSHRPSETIPLVTISIPGEGQTGELAGERDMVLDPPTLGQLRVLFPREGMASLSKLRLPLS